MSEDKKILLGSQIELIRIKRGILNQAIDIANQRQEGFNATLNEVAREHGIVQGDRKNWSLDKSDKFLYRKHPQETTVRKREGE